jgi:hypothetical protein
VLFDGKDDEGHLAGAVVLGHGCRIAAGAFGAEVLDGGGIRRGRIDGRLQVDVYVDGSERRAGRV